MPRKTRRRTTRNTTASDHLLRRLIGVLLVGAWLFVAAALVSYDPGDWPSHLVARHNAQPSNWVGIYGAFVAHKLYLVLGPGVWILVAGLITGLVAAQVGRFNQPVLRGLGLLVMALALSALIGLTAPEGFGIFSPAGGRPEGSGGLLAALINDELTGRFNVGGTSLILLMALIVGAILAMDQFVLALPSMGWRLLARGSSLLFAALRQLRARTGRSAALAAPGPVRSRGSAGRVVPAAQRAVESDAISADAGGVGAIEAFDLDDETAEAFDSDDETAEDLDTEPDEVDAGGTDGQDTSSDEASDAGVAHEAPGTNVVPKKARRQFNQEELRDKIKKLPINFADTLKHRSLPAGAVGGGISDETDLAGYQFPDLELLADAESNFTSEQEQIVRDQAVTLESALQEYRVEGEVVGIDSGPVITLFEVRLAPGTKVSTINAIASDLARALKAQNIRVVPNMVGKDTIGIEVPNLKKEKVRLKELMTSNPEQSDRMMLPMWLAKDASGNPLIADLTAMPHMLIAGTTGSGKSVCINSIIMSFLFTKRPDELKLVLVDPKLVEMSIFKQIPHLMCPVVTEMSKATAILEWATTKMDERYELLAEASVRDVGAYNALTPEQLIERFAPATEAEADRIPKKLPYIVFLIDELADLMMTAKEVEGFIVRLAQKARAVGIHLILATQRPQANVVTGLIKGNMPGRISFKVASGLDSRIVLDQKGAELLVGQGDMLYLSPRTSKLQRAQGTLVDDLEIRRTVQFLTKVAAPHFEPQLVQLKSHDLTDADEERDPLFDQAVRIVLESRRGSVSLLQRRLAIGYSRSSRLIEQMGVAGIIGDYKGSQAREVTMTLEEYEALMAQAEADVRAVEGGSAGAGEPDADAESSQAVRDEDDDSDGDDQEDGQVDAASEAVDDAEDDDDDGVEESDQEDDEQEEEDEYDEEGQLITEGPDAERGEA